MRLYIQTKALAAGRRSHPSRIKPRRRTLTSMFSGDYNGGVRLVEKAFDGRVKVLQGKGDTRG